MRLDVAVLGEVAGPLVGSLALVPRIPDGPAPVASLACCLWVGVEAFRHRTRNHPHGVVWPLAVRAAPSPVVAAGGVPLDPGPRRAAAAKAPHPTADLTPD
eukprot:11954213-Alexandrium_andersonii.AAC.1